MDNASKALIMAGAVLIAVILVSLGMMLISSGQTQVQDAIDLSDANAVAAYNNQFLTFIGSQRGSAVIQLINKAVTSNNKHVDSVTINDAEIDGSEVNDYDRNGKYEVSFDFTDGLITDINID